MDRQGIMGDIVTGQDSSSNTNKDLRDPGESTSDSERWQCYMREQRGRWTVDKIHDGRNGRDMLCYVPDVHDETTGVYVIVRGVARTVDVCTRDPDTTDGEAGFNVKLTTRRVRRGLVEAGTFEGALPHIGEACFTSKWQHEFPDLQRAVAFVTQRMQLPGRDGDATC